MNSIFHRISVRKYQAKDVEQEKIEKLLRAAMAAPSACNQQPWEFYVVTNQDVIKSTFRGITICKMCSGGTGYLCSMLPVGGNRTRIF